VNKNLRYVFSNFYSEQLTFPRIVIANPSNEIFYEVKSIPNA